MKHRTLIQKLFSQHAGSLQVFFRRRVRERSDVPDLTQEVYLRLLRASEGRTIDKPEAYLFTVANNLLREYFVMQRKLGQRVELTHPAVSERLDAEALSADFNLGQALDDKLQSQGLRAAVAELSPRSQLVLTLAYTQELSHQQIAHQLGISKTMVHKILTRAISHCRKHLAQMEIQ